MTEAFDSEPPEPTNNIVDFKLRSQLAAEAQLAAFMGSPQNSEKIVR